MTTIDVLSTSLSRYESEHARREVKLSEYVLARIIQMEAFFTKSFTSESERTVAARRGDISSSVVTGLVANGGIEPDWRNL